MAFRAIRTADGLALLQHPPSPDSAKEPARELRLRTAVSGRLGLSVSPRGAHAPERVGRERGHAAGPPQRGRGWRGVAGAGRVGDGGGGAGFTDPRVLTSSPIEIHDPALRAVTGQAKFFSITSAPTPPHPTPRPPARRLSR